MKITPENCHRIKQTIDGRPLQAIFFDEQCLILQVGFVVSNKLHWTDNKGFDVKDHFRLDLTPLSEPEPTPVAQVAIDWFKNIQSNSIATKLEGHAQNDDKLFIIGCTSYELSNEAIKFLTNLFTARVGETIKPL